MTPHSINFLFNFQSSETTAVYFIMKPQQETSRVTLAGSDGGSSQTIFTWIFSHLQQPNTELDLSETSGSS